MITESEGDKRSLLLTNNTSKNRDEIVARYSKLRQIRAANPKQTDNLHDYVTAQLSEHPFGLNGISPFANLGLEKDTAKEVNSCILTARIRVAKLFVDNMKLVNTDELDVIAEYQFDAKISEGLDIENDIVEKINSTTGRNLDKEIEQFLAGNSAFLYCGTINYQFKIYLKNEGETSAIKIDITGKTVDGYTVVPKYTCDLDVFTRATLIDFNFN